MDVTVLIATYGHRQWAELAAGRAIPSAEPQAPVIHVHADIGTLADARNQALAQAQTEWVIHLDADDELEPGYIDAIAGGVADLRAPAVRYVRGHRHHAPYVPNVAGHRHDCVATCLTHGNWLVIGTAVRADLLREVGGWREFPWSEDWDAWLRCWRTGATIEAIPAAIYRAHVRPDSRNRAPDPAFRLAVHDQIHRANFPELYRPEAA